MALERTKEYETLPRTQVGFSKSPSDRSRAHFVKHQFENHQRKRNSYIFLKELMKLLECSRILFDLILVRCFTFSSFYAKEQTYFFHNSKTTKRIRRQFEEDFAENFENGSNFGKNCKLTMLFHLTLRTRTLDQICNRDFQGYLSTETLWTMEY